MATLEQDFMTNPVTFLRKRPVFPPAGSGGASIANWNAPGAMKHASDASKPDEDTTITLKHGAQATKQFVTFANYPRFPDCLTMDLSQVAPGPAAHPTLQTKVPMFFLPWAASSIVRMRIPPVPGTLVDPSEVMFPRFFMTAGINGCSVFVEGPPEQPTIYHAGVEGKLARPSDSFWAEQMGIARDKGHVRRALHATHKKHYMGTPETQRFEEWKNSNDKSAFRIKVLENFGSMLGVRYGRKWTIYLQQNVVTQKVQIYKRSELEALEDNTGKKYYKDAGGKVVHRQVETVRPTIGGLKLPFGGTTTKTYTRMVEATSSVVAVGEVYPTRSFKADFMTEFVAES